MMFRQLQFTAAGGERFGQLWAPDQRARALVQVSHGLAEHGGRYRRAAEHLVERGYAVGVHDHPGHGRSTGPRALMESIRQYVEVQDAWRLQLLREFAGIPVYLLGHSMGGLVAVHHVLAMPEAYAGLLLSGPAFSSPVQPAAWQLLLVRLLARVAPRAGVLQLDAGGVSRDPAEVKAYLEDALVYTGRVPARTVVSMFAAMGEARRRAGEIRLPLLAMHGGDDRLTAPEGTRDWYESTTSADRALNIYPHLYHEILKEPERAQVQEDIDRWLDAHSAARTTAV